MPRSTLLSLSYWALATGIAVVALATCTGGCASQARTLSSAKAANAAVARALDDASADELARLRARILARTATCEPLDDPAEAKACRHQAAADAFAERAPERAELKRAVEIQHGFNWLLSTYDGCQAGAPGARCDETAILEELPEMVRLLGRYALPVAPAASGAHS